MDILDGLIIGVGTLLADRVFGKNETYKKLTKPLDKIAAHVHGLGDTLGEASATRKYKKMADKWLSEQSEEAQAQNKLEFETMQGKHGAEMIILFKVAIGQVIEENNKHNKDNPDKLIELDYDTVVEMVSETVKDIWVERMRDQDSSVATA